MEVFRMNRRTSRLRFLARVLQIHLCRRHLQIRQCDPCVAIACADEIILAAFKAGDLPAIFALKRAPLPGRFAQELDRARVIGQEPDFSATHKAILPIWMGGDALGVFHGKAPFCFGVIVTTFGAATLQTSRKQRLLMYLPVNGKKAFESVEDAALLEHIMD